MGFEEFLNCLRDGRRSHPPVMWGTPRDQATPADNCARMTISPEFNERIPFYGLLEGGVVPRMYLSNGRVAVLAQ